MKKNYAPNRKKAQETHRVKMSNIGSNWNLQRGEKKWDGSNIRRYSEFFKTNLRQQILSSRSTKTQGRISRQNSTQQNSSGHSGGKSKIEKIQKFKKRLRKFK